MLFHLLVVGVICATVQSEFNFTSPASTEIGHPLLFDKSNDGKHYAEFIRFDDDVPVSVTPAFDYLKVDPLLNPPQKRNPRGYRDESFDDGYEEFLKNYSKDGDHDADSYKVNEEQQEEDDDGEEDGDDEDIARSDDDDEENSSNGGSNDSNEDNDESDSDEFYKPKKSKKSKKKKNKVDGSDGKNANHCKTEKRGNLTCNICRNPGTDEKSENCSFHPKDKKYAYSRGHNNNKPHDPEQHRELTTRTPQLYYNRNNPGQLYYLRRKPSYRPSRYQVLRPVPPPVMMMIRSQMRTYPQKPPVNPYPRRYTQVGQESRLYKDVVSYEVNYPKNSSTKRPKTNQRRVKGKKVTRPQTKTTYNSASDENVDRKLADFVSKDWSNCERSFEGDQICYDCDDGDGSHRECMYASGSKPNGSSGYSRTYKYAAGTHGDNNASDLEKDSDSDSSNESKSDTTTPRRKTKKSNSRKRKTPRNHAQTRRVKKQQEPAVEDSNSEIIYGRPYEYVRPYTETSNESYESGRQILKKRMAEVSNGRQNNSGK